VQQICECHKTKGFVASFCRMTNFAAGDAGIAACIHSLSRLCSDSELSLCCAVAFFRLPCVLTETDTFWSATRRFIGRNHSLSFIRRITHSARIYGSNGVRISGPVCGHVFDATCARQRSIVEQLAFLAVFFEVRVTLLRASVQTVTVGCTITR
jgi:hypothetical protein